MSGPRTLAEEEGTTSNLKRLIVRVGDQRRKETLLVHCPKSYHHSEQGVGEFNGGKGTEGFL